MESLIAPGDTIARTLSGFVHQLRLEDVPPAVSLRARHLTFVTVPELLGLAPKIAWD